jgi:hypothetical protein
MIGRLKQVQLNFQSDDREVPKITAIYSVIAQWNPHTIHSIENSIQLQIWQCN